jgi:hypothetical protein
MTENGKSDWLITLTTMEAEAFCVVLYGLLKQYPGRILNVTGHTKDENTLVVEVLAGEHEPDGAPECSVIKRVAVEDLTMAGTRAAALAELKLEESDPVIAEIDEAYTNAHPDQTTTRITAGFWGGGL